MRLVAPVAVAVVLSSCGVVTGDVPVDETAELLTQGGETELRRRMRPIRGTTRVLVIGLDGVGGEALDGAISDGAVPALASLLGAATDERGGHEYGYAAPDVATVLPSITLAAWTAMFTGAPPGETGVPGNEWFERDGATFAAPAPVTTTDLQHAAELYTDAWLSPRVASRTLFERADVRSHVGMLHLSRGADLLTTTSATDALQMVSVLAGGITQGFSASLYAEVDAGVVDQVVAAFEAHGIPDLQVAYFPGIDLLTHSAAEPLAAQRRHLAEVIDPGIERILEAYRDAGAFDDTYVIVVSDHGHTPVHPDGAIELGGDDGAAAALDGVGFRVRPAELEVEETRFDAVFAYQCGMAYLYLADRSTCPGEEDACDWSEPPRFEEDVLPAARAFSTGAMGSRVGMVLVRSPGDGRFRALDGETLVPVDPPEEWTRFESRLRDLTTGPHAERAGDVILIARMEPSVPREERTYFGSAYHSCHGSPTAQDSIVPFVVTHPGVPPRRLRARVERALGEDRSVTALTPLVLSLLEDGAPR